jgi:phenylpyruvate tautomerase
MPLIKVTSSRHPEEPQAARDFLLRLSRLAASVIGKPEKWVMTILDAPAEMTFGGNAEPACYIEVKNIGNFSSEMTARLCSALSEELERSLSIPSSRVYIEFTDAKAHLWGYDGGTFG